MLDRLMRMIEIYSYRRVLAEYGHYLKQSHKDEIHKQIQELKR